MADQRKRSPEEFASTRWTTIRLASSEDLDIRNEAVSELILRYYPALRAYLLRRKRLPVVEADDILQGFVTDKVLERNLIGAAVQRKGKKFRSFLLKALDNYLLDRNRRLRTKKRSPEDRAVFEGDAAELILDTGHNDIDVFDVAWARKLLDEVIAVMQADCEKKKQDRIWGVFNHRLLASARQGAEPAPYDDLVERFEFESPEQACNALATAKRKFEKAFETVASQYASNFEGTSEVLAELIDILGKAPSLDWQNAPESWSDLASQEDPSLAELSDTHPQLLGQILGSVSTDPWTWSTEDLGTILKHLLQRPVLSLVGIHPSEAGFGNEASELLLKEAILSPTTDIDVLRAIKRFARRNANQKSGSFPSEIASVIYFASLASAQVNRRSQITKSNKDVLVHGFAVMNDLEWVPDEVQTLYRSALSVLQSAE